MGTCAPFKTMPILDIGRLAQTRNIIGDGKGHIAIMRNGGYSAITAMPINYPVALTIKERG